MKDPSVQLKKLRQDENIIFINENGTYKVWLYLDRENDSLDKQCIVFGYSKYVGPRYLDATIVLAIKEVHDSQFNLNLTGYPEDYTTEPVEYIRNMMDSELVSRFMSGIMDSECSSNIQLEISVENMIFHDVNSSNGSFYELGKLFGKYLKFIEDNVN